jgi:hypothetical protein
MGWAKGADFRTLLDKVPLADLTWDEQARNRCGLVVKPPEKARDGEPHALYLRSEAAALARALGAAIAELLVDGRGVIIAPMRKIVMIAIGIIMLSLVTFAHPFEGNTYGFCPLFKSPLHTANDVVVAAIDIAAVWLIYRGIRS